MCKKTIPESLAVDLLAAHYRIEYDFNCDDGKKPRVEGIEESIRKALVYHYGEKISELDAFWTRVPAKFLEKCQTHIKLHMRFKEQITAMTLIYCDIDFEKRFFRDPVQGAEQRSRDAAYFPPSV